MSTVCQRSSTNSRSRATASVSPWLSSVASSSSGHAEGQGKECSRRRVRFCVLLRPFYAQFRTKWNLAPPAPTCEGGEWRRAENIAGEYLDPQISQIFSDSDAASRFSFESAGICEICG